MVGHGQKGLKVITGAVTYDPLALSPSDSHHFKCKLWTECRLGAMRKIKVKVTLKVKVV